MAKHSLRHQHWSTRRSGSSECVLPTHRCCSLGCRAVHGGPRCIDDCYASRGRIAAAASTRMLVCFTTSSLSLLTLPSVRWPFWRRIWLTSINRQSIDTKVRHAPSSSFSNHAHTSRLIFAANDNKDTLLLFSEKKPEYFVKAKTSPSKMTRSSAHWA